MKSLNVVLVLVGLVFVGCGGGGSDSSVPKTDTTPKTETLAETKVLDVNDTVSVGATFGKVTIPFKTDDTLKSVELTGDGSENFRVSKDGEISTKTVLKNINKVSNLSTQKTVITKKIYNFKVKVTYTSGNIVYIKVQLTVSSHVEVSDVVVNTTADYYVAQDNSVHDVNVTFGTFKVIVYTDALMESTSNSTKAIYGKINGTPTNALISVNSNYVDGTAFIVKVFKDDKLVGESQKATLSGGTLEFSDITTK